MLPDAESLAARVLALRQQALHLREHVQDAGLRARLETALLELDRIPHVFPEHLAAQALLVPAGRIQTVLEIVGDVTALDTRGEPV